MTRDAFLVNGATLSPKLGSAMSHVLLSANHPNQACGFLSAPLLPLSLICSDSEFRPIITHFVSPALLSYLPGSGVKK